MDWTKLTLKEIVRWTVLLVLSCAVEYIYWTVEPYMVTVNGFTVDLVIVGLVALCIVITIAFVYWMRDMF